VKQSARELVRLCLRKDPLAWEAFVKRYANLVFWAVERSFTRCRFPFRHEDLEDTFQQVFSHLWERGLKGARGVERLEGWLAIVSYRIALDVVRRERKRGKTVSFEERVTQGEGAERRMGEFLSDRRKNPREVLEGKFREDAVKEILDTLSEKESSVLRLNLLEEKTHSEISELLKIPIGTVSSLIKRTKEELALLLKKRLGERG